MIDDALIQGVQKIANYRIKKNYPLLGENHFSKSDIVWILESLAMILEEYEVRRNKQSDNRHDESRGSKSLRKIPKK